jgi:hypothetical protein
MINASSNFQAPNIKQAPITLKKAVGTQKNRITADKAWKKDFIKILKDSPAG